MLKIAGRQGEKLGRRLRGLREEAAWALGSGRQQLHEADGGRILVYHGICEKDPFRFNTLFLTKEKFEKSLRLFKEHFNVISLDEFYAGKFSRYSVCLSFDDGFANNHKYVLPLLEQYEVPACFFVTGIRTAGYNLLWNDLLSIAGRYGPPTIVHEGRTYRKNRSKYYHDSETLNDALRRTSFEAKQIFMDHLLPLVPLRDKVHPDYWMQMSQDQIRDLSQNKWVTVGSHSCFHNDLSALHHDELQKDLRDSKSYLEGIIDREVKAISFPYGSYSGTVIEASVEAGYTQLLATEIEQGQPTHPLLRERLTTNPFISPVNQLHATIRGNYG